MVLGSLVSCGKNNSTSGDTTSTAPASITSAVTGGVSLGTSIDNYSTQFGVGQHDYYTTLGAYVNAGNELTYSYTKISSSSNNQNCTTKLFIFKVCTQTTPVVSRKVSNSSVDITAKINELKGYINNANPLIAIKNVGTSYTFNTKDGKTYVIDRSYPLQANPVLVMDENGASMEYLFDIR